MARASDHENLAKRAWRATGLSLREFAALLGVSHPSVARWVAGEMRPSGTSRGLLYLIEKLPDPVVRILQEANNPVPNEREQEEEDSVEDVRMSYEAVVDVYAGFGNPLIEDHIKEMVRAGRIVVEVEEGLVRAFEKDGKLGFRGLKRRSV